MASLLPTSIHRQLLLLMVLLSNAAPGIAQPSSQSLVREVLSCTRAEERFVIARDEGFKVGFNSASGPQALPEPLKQEIFALFRRIADDVYSWKTMEPRFVRLYQRYYTREQLEAIREYCTDPTYRAVVDTELRMLPDAMRIGNEFQPELQRLLREGIQELLGRSSR